MGIGIGIGISSVRLAGGGGWLFYDSFASDGALGNDWSGATWTVSGGALINTPSLGSELLVNGDMETGDPPTGWNSASGSTLDGVADERTGGSGVQSLNVQRGSNTHSANKTTGSGQVEWHRIEAYLKNVDAQEIYITAIPSAGSGITEIRHETDTSWLQGVATTRLTAAAAITMRLQVTNTSGQQARFDDVSIKKITRSSLFATVDAGVANVNLSAPRISTYRQSTQSGIVLCVDDAANPANFVVAYIDDRPGAVSPSVIIEECVAGAYTVLATELASLSTTKHFSAKKNGDQLYVFYGTDDFGTLVGGAPVTINSALVDNTRHGLMSAAEVNAFSGSFTLARYTA